MSVSGNSTVDALKRIEADVLARQPQLDALPAGYRFLRWLRPVARAAQLHRLTSCLCAVAEKTTYF